MAYTYKAVDPESGNRWCVRIVFIGDTAMVSMIV